MEMVDLVVVVLVMRTTLEQEVVVPVLQEYPGSPEPAPTRGNGGGGRANDMHRSRKSRLVVAVVEVLEGAGHQQDQVVVELAVLVLVVMEFNRWWLVGTKESNLVCWWIWYRSGYQVADQLKKQLVVLSEFNGGLDSMALWNQYFRFKSNRRSHYYCWWWCWWWHIPWWINNK